MTRREKERYTQQRFTMHDDAPACASTLPTPRMQLPSLLSVPPATAAAPKTRLRSAIDERESAGPRTVGKQKNKLVALS